MRPSQKADFLERLCRISNILEIPIVYHDSDVSSSTDITSTDDKGKEIKTYDGFHRKI